MFNKRTNKTIYIIIVNPQGVVSLGGKTTLFRLTILDVYIH
jgi:hypothetical protein